MNLLTPPRCFDPDSPELIDRPGLDRTLLREELQILEKANRYSGGHVLVLQSLERLLGPAWQKSVSILDLGTGLGDIPRALVAWARQRGLPISVSAVDRNPEVLQLAREVCADWPEIRLEQHDLRALPQTAKSFDVVVCSLALHHFTAPEAVAILGRMNEIARVGLIVNDLRRNWLSLWMTNVLSRILIRSPIFRHDAIHSCRAAFTVDELRAMAHEAGLGNFQIRRCQGVFRMVLEGKK